MVLSGLVLLFVFSGVAEEKNTNTIDALLYSNGKPVSVKISGNKISKVTALKSNAKVPQMYVAPGLIDIQINGYMGVDFADQDLTLEGIRKATRALWKEGVTTYLPTLITADQKSLKNSFSILSQALADEETGPSIPGFHLEGPFISPEKGFRGAHLEKYIRKPERRKYGLFTRPKESTGPFWFRMHSIWPGSNPENTPDGKERCC